jgi:hypothetical protein
VQRTGQLMCELSTIYPEISGSCPRGQQSWNARTDRGGPSYASGRRTFPISTSRSAIRTGVWRTWRASPARHYLGGDAQMSLRFAVTALRWMRLTISKSVWLARSLTASLARGALRSHGGRDGSNSTVEGGSPKRGHASCSARVADLAGRSTNRQGSRIGRVAFIRRHRPRVVACRAGRIASRSWRSGEVLTEATSTPGLRRARPKATRGTRVDRYTS